MSKITKKKSKSCDWIWDEIQKEAGRSAKKEPSLASFLYETILNHHKLEEALSFHLANKLSSPPLPAMVAREIIELAYKSDKSICRAIRKDIIAVRERDPASHCFSTPFLYFKGFHALQSFRVSNWLWRNDRRALALFFQNRISEVYGVDIHPAASFGSGILIDHATGVVVGETAVVENNVSILHGVTLGGTGKENEDRHPKVREGVLIGACTQILGNIEIGKGSKIGAGSVVLEAVPPHSTATGVPAKIVGRPQFKQPALEMDHTLFGVFSDDDGASKI
ncbi:MAG: serine O-acetyltransferase [Fibrobacteria bacterium]|nr:serine O-acetyltransferase [Fibrobacteria bacterium]